MKILAPRGAPEGARALCSFAADVPDELVGDAARLRQVVVNLVGNAVKFTERGEVAVEDLAWPASRRSRSTSCGVRDTGIGIPPRTSARRSSQSFVQADGSTTRRFGGTGLGLAICESLVG